VRSYLTSCERAPVNILVLIITGLTVGLDAQFPIYRLDPHLTQLTSLKHEHLLAAFKLYSETTQNRQGMLILFSPLTENIN